MKTNPNKVQKNSNTSSVKSVESGDPSLNRNNRYTSSIISDNALLRQNAEELLKKGRIKTDAKLSEAESQKLIHELAVHQIMLELQNEELMSAIAETKAAYSKLYDNAPFGYFTLSKDTEIVELNLVASQMLNHDRSFLIYKRFDEYVSNDTKQIFHSFIDKLFTSKVRIWCDVVLLENGNTPIDVHLTGTLSENSKQCDIIAVDISEQKRADNLLRRSEEQYRSVTQSANDAIIISNNKGIIIDWNSGARKIFGYTESDIIGKEISLLIPPRFVEQHKIGIQRLADGGEDRIIGKTMEVTALHKNGTEIPLELSISKWKTIGGNYYSGIARDITERKQIEEALRVSEEKYKYVAEHTSDGIISFGPDNRIVFMSTAYRHQLGYDEQGMLNRTVNDIYESIHPDDRVKVFSDISKAIEMKQKELVYVYRTKHKNGHYIWREDNARFLYDSSGIYQGSNVVCRDITERKQIEEDLKKSREDFRGYFQMGSIGMCVTSTEKGWIEVNDRLCQMLGYTKEELSVATWAILTHPDDLNADIELFNQVLSGKRDGYEIEKRYIRKDGSIIYTTLSVTCRRNTDGTVNHFLASVLDITDRKKSEKALAESDEQFRNFFEYSIVGKSITTMDGKVKSNSAYRQMLGYTEDEISKLQWQTITHPDSIEIDQQIFDSIISGEKKSESWEKKYIHKNGNTVWVNISTTLHRDGNGNPLYFITTVIDITKRRHAEESLKASEEQYRNLFQTMIQGVVYQDAGGRIISANPASERILGLSLDQMQGRTSLDPFWHAIHEDGSDFPGATHPAMVALSSGQPVLNVIMGVFHPKSGNYVWINVNAMPLFKPNETIPYQVHATFDDITARKHAEEALRESTERFNALFYNVPLQGVIYRFIRDERGEIVDWEFSDINALGAESFGKGAVELIGKRATEVFGSEALAAYFEISRQVAKTGQPQQFETQFEANGHSYLSVVFLVGTEHYANVSVDITSRKQAEMALKESEEKYRLLYESNQMPIAIFEAETLKFLSVNNAFVDKYGYTREEFSTMTILEIRPDSEIERVKQSIKIIDKGLVNLGEYLHKKKNGDIINVEIMRYDLVFEGKNAKLVFANDITDRKNSEQALRNAQKLESIGTLAGGIAHDFNNLLNAIMGQCALALKKLPENNTSAGHITKALKASERAAELTKQLLAYSGRGKFLMERIDLNQLVRENISILEISVAKNAELRYELCTPAPCIIADSGQIQQIIMNLIINASDAMEMKPGVITVRTNIIELTHNDSKYWEYTQHPLVPGRYAFLQVSDTGIGINQETLGRIFDPFFTTKFTGRGLGLAAVMGIIKGHKGGLRIESEVGKGTTFEIVFPLGQTSEITNVPVKKKSLELDGEGKTVFIIDDDPFVFQMLEDIITEYHFTVRGTSDPIQGIEYYRQEYQNISMVVLDYSMPHLNGKDVFEKLIQINENVKVLLCSGYTEDDTLSNFGKERPTGYFQKPYKPEALMEIVSEILSKDHST